MKYIHSLFKELRQIDSILQQSYSLHKIANNSLAKTAKQFQNNTIGFQNGISIANKLSHQIQSFIKPYESIEKWVNLYTDPFINWIIDARRKYSKKVKKAIKSLAENGWFYDLDMEDSLLFEISELMENNQTNQAIEKLQIYFQTNLEEIKNQLVINHPNRKNAFLAAFTAHNKSEYILSIPVFFSQTDGICYDEAKKDFFRKAGKRPQIASYTESFISDEMMGALLAPINEFELSIYKGEKDRAPDFNELNRHQVIHGEIIDYGTEINSLKAISLLYYISKALMLCREDDNEGYQRG